MEIKLHLEFPLAFSRSEMEKGIFALNIRCLKFLMLFSEFNPNHEF